MIRVEWVRWNIINCKQIEKAKAKIILSRNPEINLENIKCIYVNFDRNEKERKRRIWITNFQESEKKLELEDKNYQFLNEICK